MIEYLLTVNALLLGFFIGIPILVEATKYFLKTQDNPKWNIFSPNDKENIVISSNDNIISQEYFRGRGNIRSVHFCSPDTEIETATFSGCETIETVELPSNLTVIKLLTFAYCEKLNSVIIPNSVEKIEDSAFLHCNNLKEITIHGNIGEDAFAYCAKLTYVKLEKSGITIAAGAFRGCKSLSSIIIPNKKRSHSFRIIVDDYAFAGLKHQVMIKYSSGTSVPESDLLKIFNVKTLDNFTWLIKPTE